MADEKVKDWLTISFTKESWTRFKTRFKRAVDQKEKQFMFDDHEFVTAFAKYFIEHYDAKFK